MNKKYGHNVGMKQVSIQIDRSIWRAAVPLNLKYQLSFTHANIYLIKISYFNQIRFNNYNNLSFEKKITLFPEA
ncbi:MAG: hypothetical protein KAJ16_09850, partial [Calditrichia bacterium]|nr:hypothetical protein [Calditrichia bacterium]